MMPALKVRGHTALPEIQIQPTLYLDVSGLLLYAVDAETVTGIQRVELSFLHFLIREKRDFVPLNAFGISSSKLKGIFQTLIDEPQALLHALKQECDFIIAFRRPLQLARYACDRWFNRFLKQSWTGLSQIKAGDTLLVLGAFWSNPDILDYYKAVIKKRISLLVYLHDVLPITRHDLVLSGSHVFFEGILRLPISVLTPTAFTQRDVRRATTLVEGARPLQSIHVLPLAHEFPDVARNTSCKTESQRLKQMMRGRSFVLCVGTIEIRKNHFRLLQLWRRLAVTPGKRLPLLVIAGKRGWGADPTLTLLDQANYRDRFEDEPYIFIEEPTEEELQYLYASCDFTIFPSLAEGWGLPVGESLWFGKACAASRTTSIPEVGGDLCVYFDPTRENEIENAIRTLLDEQRRASYERKIKEASLRCWEDVGRDLLNIASALAKR